MTIKIGFDYDEPIFPWYTYAHQASLRAGIALPEHEPTSWAPHETYGCTLEEWIAVLDAEVQKGYDGMYGLPCDPDAVAAVRKAHCMGFEVHIITARGSLGQYGDEIKRLTKSQKIREGIPGTLHFAPDKFEVIRDLGLDYFIDDRPKHYEESVRAGADTYLLDATWNKDTDVPYGRRVYSTPEYVARIMAKSGPQVDLGKQPFEQLR